ncbi:hypothetical protein M0805_002452 [Coniferiporia weirii]|nr:hypothetical protein M0805_002452 [Coniferiporia weirii]
MASGAVDPDEILQPLSFDETLQESERLLREEPSQTIKSAKGGDLQALQALSSNPNATPDGLAGDACEALCVHLRQDAPSANSRKGISRSEELALLSVAGLGDLLRNFSCPEFEGSIQKSWKAIAKWLLLFQEKHLRKNPRGSSYLALYMAVLLDVVTTLGVKEQICSDHKILKLIVHLWTDGEADGDRGGHASKCFSVCSEASSEARWILLTQMLNECHGVPDVAALNLERRIRIASYDFPERAETLDSFASVLLAFFLEPGEQMTSIQMSFALNEGIYDVSELLDRSLVGSLPPRDSDKYELACSATAKLFRFVLRSIEVPYGSVWVIPALHSGFLGALIRFCPFLDTEPLRTSDFGIVANAFTETIPRFLMTPSIIIEAVLAMDKAYSYDAKKGIMSSIVSKEWEYFESYLLERAAYKALFDRNEDKEPPTQKCGNPDCDEEDSGGIFKRCSGCKDVRYCSRQCQVIAWKYKGHNLECKKEKDTKKQKNDEFVFYCARRDLLRHLPGVQNLAKRQFPNIPFNTIGVVIDYSTLPPRFQVKRLETFVNETTRRREVVITERTNAVLKRAHAGKDDVIFTKIIQSSGKGNLSTTYTEVSITSANAFNVPADVRPPSSKVELKRITALDSDWNPLEVVEFDLVDKFLYELQSHDTADDEDSDGVTTSYWTKLKELVGKPEKIRP